MQILKDSIRENIQISAKSLFLENGYEKTSMREIAAHANISKSNLYNYFKNKEHLYDVLTLSIRNNSSELLSIIFNHEFDAPFGSEDFCHLLSSEIYNYLLRYREDFLLIMNSSATTIYASFKENLIKEMQVHFIKDIQCKNQNYDYYILEIIARNLVEGLINIAKNRMDASLEKIDLYLLIKYHVKGILPLLKDSL
jgi:AcrR family transcriptional regulator